VFSKLVRAALGHAKNVSLHGLSFDPFVKTQPECSEQESKEVCVALLKQFSSDTEYQFGKTKVFLRNGASERLHGTEDAFFAKKVIRE
jgi:myosin heavy subunit